MYERKSNIRIMQTQITPQIRISTAGIFCHEGWGKWFQYETWCFSDDSKQKTFQVIHGTASSINQYYLKKAIKIHRYISNNLQIKYNK